ncbi:hypothetical protein BN946_scf184762.g4 [Trametes cinnabarina]|uniref:BAG domain-containing protein n=1 Tax=Pycnoporus cinnabarinus TaxID=5643 RepID=A0A060S9B2_PYCCI|nr:hypothetical protein BN946_scf184762.g4 [Trametes cinnabarina]
MRQVISTMRDSTVAANVHQLCSNVSYASTASQRRSSSNVLTSRRGLSPALSSPTLLSSNQLAALVPLILLFAVVVYAQVRPSIKGKDKSMSIVVKWGRERLQFPLPPPDATLGQLRHEIAEYTHLPEKSFKLIHAGAVMKDDNAPISAYGIKPGSKIALIGTGDTLPPPPSRAARKEKEPRTEQGTVSQIRTELDKVRNTLRPDVESFLAALSPSSAAAQVGPSPTRTAAAPKPASAAASGSRAPADLEKEHLRLGELLLQTLLRLDAINAEGEWEEARRERKGAVKEVQSLLDRLDSGWRARARH